MQLTRSAARSKRRRRALAADPQCSADAGGVWGEMLLLEWLRRLVPRQSKFTWGLT